MNQKGPSFIISYRWLILRGQPTIIRPILSFQVAQKIRLLASLWKQLVARIMNDEHSKTIFKLLNNHTHWQSKARKLKHCADLLFNAFLAAKALSDEEQSETQDSEIDDVATLLYGMAMEDILKAALLKEGIAKKQPDGTVKWGAEVATKHDLLGMYCLLQAGHLDAGQEKLMERMSAFVFWAGKYPTPLKIKDGAKDGANEFKGFQLSNQPRAGIKTRPVPFNDEDKEVFDQIYKAINQRV